MGKRNRRISYLVSGGLILLLIIIIAWRGLIYVSSHAYLLPDTKEWHTGDIFFSVGNSWESMAVRSLTGMKYFEVTDSTPSHCGVIIRDADKVVLVHESTVAKKIVAETPEEYLINNGSYCLFAVKVFPKPDSTEFRHVVDSLILKGTPFDFAFDHTNSQFLYCTEMVLQVFELNDNLCFSSLRQQKYIYPEDLLKLCVNR